MVSGGGGGQVPRSPVARPGRAAYLARLLLEEGKLLDCTLEVGLQDENGQYGLIGRPAERLLSGERTLASSSAWGICWSTSLVKSLSGFSAGLAMMGGVLGTTARTRYRGVLREASIGVVSWWKRRMEGDDDGRWY